MIFTILTVSVLIFFACTKHRDDVVDNSPRALLQFESPTIGAFYNSGDSVLIKGTATYSATIHGYDVIVRKANETETLFFKHYHDHKTKLDINTKWKANVSGANLQAELKVYLDHDGHIDSKKVGFSIR